MLSINEATKKLKELIEARVTSMQLKPPIKGHNPQRIIGEMMLDKFAIQLLDASKIIELQDGFEEELIENLLTVLALAGLTGIDLETQLNNLLTLLESVNSEAS